MPATRPALSQTWCAALSLAERVSLLRSNSDTKRCPSDQQRAEKHIARWLKISPFSEDGYLRMRLESEGIAYADFTRVLGESAECIEGRTSRIPDWLSAIYDAFEANGARTELPINFDSPEHSIIRFLEPLINQAWRRIVCHVDEVFTEHETTFDSDRVSLLLANTFPNKLTQNVVRTFTLELHVARLQQQLGGDTAEERFNAFLERLQKREHALALLSEYPLLARRIVIVLDQWVHACQEFVSRLAQDWPKLREQFSLDADSGNLRDLTCTGAETHRDGRFVIFIELACGTRLVYKPRPMAPEYHFQNLLKWLRDNNLDLPPLRLLNVLDCGSYGWVEYVAQRPCESKEEVKLFYRRQGVFIALLYVLNATDFHYENLIAAGEHPVLVDLETIYQPTIPPPQDNNRVAIAISQMLGKSVMNSGLLPRRVWTTETGPAGLEVSGLGGKAGQQTPYKVLQWTNPLRDDMHAVHEQSVMPGGNNRPLLPNHAVHLADYVDDILAGFTATCEFLRDNQSAFLYDSPLRELANAEMRVIIRDTRSYYAMLQDATHPDFLRDALRRDCMFDRLWSAVPNLPYLAKVIHREQRDLAQTDVPLFYTYPHSRDLFSSTGERIADFFPTSATEETRHRLSRLTDDELQRQQWLIRASITITETAAHNERSISLSIPAEATSLPLPTPDAFMAAAVKIGDRLMQLAFDDNHDENVIWSGINPVDDTNWTLAPVSIDLYAGLPGIALFFAYLGELTSTETYRRIAHQAVSIWESMLELTDGNAGSLGLFSGLGGVVYTYTCLAQLCDRPSLFERAEHFIELMRQDVENDTAHDIVAGNAGAIISLLSYHQFTQSEIALEVAQQAGLRLIASAEKTPVGLGWRIPGFLDRQPLHGFAHGAGGIAFALTKLASTTSDSRFMEAAIQAIEYEHSLYSDEIGNWPDLISPDVKNQTADPKASTVAWCHGAAGILLSRIHLLRECHSPLLLEDIQRSLEIVQEQGFGHNHSLCHGDLGNLDILRGAAHLLKNEELQQKADGYAAACLQTLLTEGPVSGVPRGVETPGLMTGLAGTGYGLLRLANPQRVPCILIGEAPGEAAWSNVNTTRQ